MRYALCGMVGLRGMGALCNRPLSRSRSAFQVPTSAETRALKKVPRKEPKARVVMETCAEAFRVADAMKEAGHEVRVVPSLLVKALGVGARGKKTDVADARALSEASMQMSELPSVHIPSTRARELRSVLQTRRTLVGARTMLINNVRGYLRGRLHVLSRGAVRSFASGCGRSY